MIIHECEQRSPEWYAVRAGKMTGSNALTIATGGKGLETYIYSVLAEKHCITREETYTNDHIERGIQLEAGARTLFELETGKTVKEVGFIEIDEYAGASPDGIIIEENAIIEIKCHMNAKHFKLMVHGEQEIEKGYLYQMHMEMYAINAEYGYYVAYNPNFERSLLIYKIKKNPEIIDKLCSGLEKGKNLIQEIEKKYENR